MKQVEYFSVKSIVAQFQYSVFWQYLAVVQGELPALGEQDALELLHDGGRHWHPPWPGDHCCSLTPFHSPLACLLTCSGDFPGIWGAPRLSKVRL